MRSLFAVALLGLSLSACSITPYKRALPEGARSQFNHAVIYASADKRGIGAQYLAQDSSAAGAQYGLIGALVTATIDAIANATPLSIAQDAADAVGPALSSGALQTELELALTLSTAPSFPGGATVRALPEKMKGGSVPSQPALKIALEYALATDLRSLQVVAYVDAFNKSVNGADKKTGLVYRNRFEYHSAVLAEPPPPPQEEVNEKVAAIRAKYLAIKAKRKLTSKDELQMKREIARVQGVDSKGRADMLVQKWVADDFALLTSEVRTGTSTVLALLARDIDDRFVPDPNKKQALKTTLETQQDRVVSRFNGGAFSGSLSSEPRGFVTPASNGVAYGHEINNARTAAR